MIAQKKDISKTQAIESKPGTPPPVPHVVIIGGGFGGLTAAKKLAGRPVKVTLIDRMNHHLFQPMLYQVATTALAPGDIATPLRDALHHQRNTTVLMGEVTGVDTQRQLVLLEKYIAIHYDYLILATGASNNYFGHPEWANLAPGMKTLEDAIAIKNGQLLALEAAEREPDEEKRKAFLTVVLVGGGPTGCELAAMLAEHMRTLKQFHFRHIHTQDARIILVEGTRLIASFHPSLSKKMRRRLNRLGVEVRTGIHVTEVTDKGVMVGDEFLATKRIIWTAGVEASPAGQWLHAKVDQKGRVTVQDDLSVPGCPNVFVIGHAALVLQHGKELPGLAQPAIQEGKYMAATIADRVAGKEHQEPFQYFDKGSLAVVGRTYAIFERGSIRLAGSLVWLLWVFVHIYFLIGFCKRLIVFCTYAWAYLNPFQQSPEARLIFRKLAVRASD